MAIAVDGDGYREVFGAAEGMEEDKTSWVNFFQWRRGRGLDGVKLIVGDKCLGMLEAVVMCSLKPSTSAAPSTSTATCFLWFPAPRRNWWLAMSFRE